MTLLDRFLADNQVSRIYNNIKIAYQNGDFKEVVSGEKPYRLPPNPYEVYEQAAIVSIFLCHEFDESNVPNLLVQTLLEDLINGKPFLVIEYLVWYLEYYPKDDRAVNKIWILDVEAIVQKLNEFDTSQLSADKKQAWGRYVAFIKEKHPRVLIKSAN